MSPLELPPSLGDAFSVSAALDAGVSAKRLRSAALETPYRGARLARGEQAGGDEEDDARRRIRAFAQIMPPDAFFIGPTAALIGGVPLPRGMHRELHVAVPYPRTPPRRPGIRGRRVSVAGHVVERGGLRLSDPALTWVTLGEHLDEYDLVAAADHLLRVPRAPGGLVELARTTPYAVREDLECILAENRWRAAPRLRSALGRARTGSSSRPETWSRLILVDAGLPEPELDWDIVDDNGEFVACADLAYPHARVSIEYEGDGHRDKRQFARDIDRYERVLSAGWRPVRVASTHVFRTPSELVRRVCVAVAART